MAWIKMWQMWPEASLEATETRHSARSSNEGVRVALLVVVASLAMLASPARDMHTHTQEGSAYDISARLSVTATGLQNLSQSGASVLKLVPEAAIVGTETATVTIDVILQTGDGPVDGVDVYLNVDTAYLRITDAQGNVADSVTAGQQFPIVLQNRVSNVTGQINFSAGILIGDPLSGMIRVARFYVSPLRVSRFGWTAILFSHEPLRLTNAAFAGYSVLAGTEDGRIYIPQTRLLLPAILSNVATLAAPGAPSPP